jgi:hypothetical protein
MAKKRDRLEQAILGAECVVDQEWAACVDAMRASERRSLLAIRELYYADDAGPLVQAMLDDPQVAQFTQRLALLAWDEAMTRLLRNDNEDGTA